jgi:hypothetical protein
MACELGAVEPERERDNPLTGQGMRLPGPVRLPETGV